MSVSERPGGHRRIDRVLAEGYLDDLPNIPLDEVRALRGEAEQEETDLSYLRRLLQGRMDILRAELVNRLRKKHETGEDVITGADVQRLTDILAGRAVVDGEEGDGE